MVIGINNAMKASRDELVAQTSTSDPTKSLVELPMFGFRPTVHSPKAILEEEENYLSPEERLEKRRSLTKQKAKLFKSKREQVLIIVYLKKYCLTSWQQNLFL